MTESDRQWEFLQDVALLIQYAARRGMKLTGGSLYRDPGHNRYIGGAENSMHLRRMAIDLNLFHGQDYVASTEAHRPLGAFWESLRPENSWGGRFNNPDGNHYSRYERDPGEAPITV